MTFWDVLCGAADPDQLEGPDREMWEEIEARGGLYGRPDRMGADDVDEYIERATLPAPDVSTDGRASAPEEVLPAIRSDGSYML